MKRIIPVFFIALGMVLGAAFVGSLGGLLTNQPPLKIMNDIARDIKLYAIISAIGGTLTSLRILEGGFSQGELLTILQQFLVLVSAYLGAQLGYWLILTLSGGT